MIIEKIAIESFASHKDVEIELGDGINLIEGTNESGKSSIADFIKFMLYGVGGKGVDSHLSERKRVMNFNDSHIAGALTVRVGERRLCIRRNTAVSGTVRESVRTRITVTDEATGQDIYDGREPGEMLLGIPEDLFSASVYLSQSGGAVSGASVNESISNILFSGDERMSAERAQERIEKARIPISHKHGRVGKIYDIRDELDSLRGKLALELETNERIVALESSVLEKRRTNAEHIERYTELEAQQRAYELSKIIESCEALEGAEREKVSSELAALEYRAEVHIPTDEETEELYSYERSLRLLDSREEELASERAAAISEREGLLPALRLSSMLEEGTDVSHRVRESLARAKKHTVAFCIFFAFAVVCAALSFLIGDIALILYVASAACVGVGALFILLCTKNKKTAKDILIAADCKSADELEGAVERCKNASVRISELDEILRDNSEDSAECAEISARERERFAEYLSEMDIEGTRASCEFISEIGEIFRARVRHASELDALAREKRAYYDALMLKAENVDVDKARAELGALGVENAACLDPEKLTRNAQFYREQSSLLSEKIHATELELADLRARVGSPAAVCERITYLESELALCERKLAVYTLASDGLKKASEELRRSVAPTIARISGEYMSALTDGRYTELSLDHTFALTYKSGGELRHIDHMSTGTRDMAYLSLRLALSDVISGEEELLVMLDEATAHMDDTRAKNLITLLSDRAEKGHQHILFTCHKREAALLCGIGVEFNHILLGE